MMCVYICECVWSGKGRMFIERIGLVALRCLSK